MLAHLKTYPGQKIYNSTAGYKYEAGLSPLTSIDSDCFNNKTTSDISSPTITLRDSQL